MLEQCSCGQEPGEERAGVHDVLCAVVRPLQGAQAGVCRDVDGRLVRRQPPAQRLRRCLARAAIVAASFMLSSLIGCFAVSLLASCQLTVNLRPCCTGWARRSTPWTAPSPPRSAASTESTPTQPSSGSGPPTPAAKSTLVGRHDIAAIWVTFFSQDASDIVVNRRPHGE